MMPVARVMCLYRRHTGEKALAVTDAPDGLDVTASRTGDTVYLHVVNTRRDSSVEVRLAAEGTAIESGRVFEIAAAPESEIMATCPDAFSAVEKALPDGAKWTFPAASVSAVELNLAGNGDRA